MCAATGIAPQFLLDPELPPDFIDLLIWHHNDLNKKR